MLQDKTNRPLKSRSWWDVTGPHDLLEPWIHRQEVKRRFNGAYLPEERMISSNTSQPIWQIARKISLLVIQYIQLFPEWHQTSINWRAIVWEVKPTMFLCRSLEIKINKNYKKIQAKYSRASLHNKSSCLQKQLSTENREYPLQLQEMESNQFLSKVWPWVMRRRWKHCNCWAISWMSSIITYSSNSMTRYRKISKRSWNPSEDNLRWMVRGLGCPAGAEARGE